MANYTSYIFLLSLYLNNPNDENFEHFWNIAKAKTVSLVLGLFVEITCICVFTVWFNFHTSVDLFDTAHCSKSKTVQLQWLWSL